MRNDGFPLDDMQMAYYVGEQPGLPLATTARFLREMAFPPMDAQRIENAWNALIRRHDMLRAVLGADGQQRVLPAVPHYPVERRDLAQADDAAMRRGQEDLREAMWETRLPLDAWPQFDVRMLVEPTGVRLFLRFNLWTLDAISMQILLAELLALCDAPDTPLPPVRDTFRRYIEQRTASRNTRGARARDYWAKRAHALPPGPDLPLDKGAGEIARKPTFVHLCASLPAADWQRFSTFAEQQRVTPTFAIIAAYAGALARWSSRRHFTITILLSKRPFADGDMEQVVGNFGTTLLLEIDLRQPTSFADFARAVQKQFWKDVANIDVSGIEVAREVNRAQGSALRLVAPVTFTSMMASNNLSDAQQAALKRLRHVGSRLDVPQVLLDHQVAEEPQGDLTMNWDYVGEAFAPGVIDDMFDAFVGSLRQLAESERDWTDAPYRAPLPAPQQRAWDTLNATQCDFPDLLLDDLVEAAVRAHPDNVAVVCGGRRITYATLWAAAGALARRLSAAGVCEGRVAVTLPKSAEQLVAVLAIVRAGAAYVPIDPSLPTQRQNELLARSSAVAVVTTPALAETRAWPANLPVVAVTAPEDALADEAGGGAQAPARARSSRDIAYVIFTSGSTGTPKGVVIDHRGAVNTILDINRRLAVGERDRVLALSSLSFDLSVYDIFGLLATGGAVVVPTPAELGNPTEWARLVNDTGVTLWNSVPALFQLGVDAARDLGTPMPTLRHVMMSGDWIPLPLPEQGRRMAPAARIHSLGGATEVSIWSVIHEIGELDPQWPTIPYGRPLANQQAYVLDDQFQPCPLWKTGELYLAGAGVARGYLGDVERTRERFLTAVIDGQVLYRTGDLARLRPGGDLEFLGRCDHQIKLRGFRIELGEIEAALTSCAGVGGAVVKALGGADADKQLVAFATAEPGAGVVPQSLRAALQDTLPAYMIPSAIHVLDALPLTANGKVDHAALTELHARSAAQAGAPARRGAGDAASGSATALSLAPLWEEILGVGAVGADDGFFALGGTSFQALQLVGKVRERFGATLTLDAFTSTLTLQGLADLIDSKPGATGAAQPVIVLRQAGAGETEASLSLFCIHAVGGAAHAYMPLGAHLPAGVRMFGIQRTDATPDEAERSSIEALADDYADRIRRAAPTGPMALLGWSMGAAVAVETARRLVAAGRDVCLTALIDPYYLPADAARPPVRDADPAPMLEAFCRDLAGIAGLRYAPPERALAQQARDDDARFAAYMADLVDQKVLPADPPVAHLRRVFDTFSRNLGALYAYRPTSCDVDVLLLRATHALSPEATALRPWTPAARTVDEHAFDCDHFAIMRAPLIERVASLVTDRLVLERA
ncbi:hypothetical protein BZL54_19040 [Burkholderia ubonensis subsp. mesacidophila]|uniref:Carrier domain-containing protein n=1 Tax=Burkholderia ubonensis subsp. mesacidophila TaxID=265293 RepID=A0A2A4FCK8_9BURK|nr:hypothetical protein BZL54_19040 [Burkholderia ubonensis subsp. mesacidophila]